MQREVLLNDEQNQALQHSAQELKRQFQQYSNIIICLGDAGHGKSSFVRMLVDQSQKINIISNQQAFSVTNKITGYKIGKQIKRKMGISEQQNIVIIDTPGVDRQMENSFSGFKVTGLLTDMIRANKFNLLAIIYVVSLEKSRPFDEKGNNRFLQFFKIFPIELKNKLNINFTIFTNADRVDQDDAKLRIQNFYEAITQFKHHLLKRNLKWMSEPQNTVKKIKQRQKFFKKIKEGGDCFQDYNKQWKILGEMIQENLSKVYSPQMLEENNKKFENSIFQEIKKQLENIENIQSSLQKLNYYIDPSLLIIQKDNKTMKNLNLAIKSRMALQNLLKASIILSGALLVPSALIGVFGVGLWKYLKNSDLAQILKLFFKKKSTENVNYNINEQIQIQYKQLALKISEKKIAEEFQIEKNNCYLEKKQWIKKMIINFMPIEQKKQKESFLWRLFFPSQNLKQQKIQANVCKKKFQKDAQKKEYYCFQFLQNNKAHLQLELRVPSEKKMAQIVKKVGQQMFYTSKET